MIFPFVLVQKSDVCWFLWLVTGEQWLNILVVCLVFFLFFGASRESNDTFWEIPPLLPQDPMRNPMRNPFV